MRVCFVVAFVFLFCVGLTTGFTAASQTWQPSGIVPTQANAESIVAANRASIGTLPVAQRVEQYHLAAVGNVSLDPVATIRGSDFRINTIIDGSLYSSGRTGFRRWRRTPAGVVRVIESDVQGDDLDRWPLTVLGFDSAYCSALGETRGTAPDWVLQCLAPGSITHWYYIAKATGRIVREIAREGSRVTTFDFSDFRSSDGTTRPYHWQISGSGGDAGVQIVNVVAKAISAGDVALPTSASAAFSLPAGGARIPATFDRWFEMKVPVEVNGHTVSFDVDTGTTQILMDIGAAVRSGLRPTLNHAIASDFRVGAAMAHDMPIETTSIFNGSIPGLLGNEFFIGHIVHINYRTQVLQRKITNRFAG